MTSKSAAILSIFLSQNYWFLGCKHSQNLQPIIEKAAEQMKGESMKIVAVDGAAVFIDFLDSARSFQSRMAQYDFSITPSWKSTK